MWCHFPSLYHLHLRSISPLGKDLIGVQNLLKKHQALQAEIGGHEPRIKAVTQKGEAMVEEGMCSFFPKKRKLKGHLYINIQTT